MTASSCSSERADQGLTDVPGTEHDDLMVEDRTLPGRMSRREGRPGRPARAGALGRHRRRANLIGSLLKPLGLAFLFPTALALGYGEPAGPSSSRASITSLFGAGLEW